MANYNGGIDLLKIKGAFKAQFAGKSATKECLMIPLDCLHVTDKGQVYLNFSMWVSRDSRYGESHYLKQSFNQAERENLTEEERRQFIGNMKEIQGSSQGASQPAKPARSTNEPPF